MLNVSKLIFLFYFVTLLFEFTNTKTCSCKLPNVGTVLFRKTDVRKIDCWSREEVSLLYSRRIFQELLPRTIPCNIALHNFIMMCLDTIHDLAGSDYSFIMTVIAFADVFGGFLHTYGLSLLNEAYYEGFVSYSTSKKLYDIQNDLKSWLGTDGGSWAPRIRVRDRINEVLPLEFSEVTEGSACSRIVVANNTHPGQKKWSNSTLGVYIPLPLIDNVQKPTAIAVPLKDRTLYSLQDQYSYNILVVYFITVSDCFAELSKTDDISLDQSVFDHKFHNWLIKDVLPHLNDETWFVGFSSVLQIEETLKSKKDNMNNFPNDIKNNTVKTNYMRTKANFPAAIWIICFAVLVIAICILLSIYKMFCREYCFNYDTESFSNFGTSTENTSLVTSSMNSELEKPVAWTCKYKGMPESIDKTRTSNENQYSNETIPKFGGKKFRKNTTERHCTHSNGNKK